MLWLLNSFSVYVNKEGLSGVALVDLMSAYVFLQSTKAHHTETKNDVIYCIRNFSILFFFFSIYKTFGIAYYCGCAMYLLFYNT